MYNRIGLQTPRGSGTSGYVQANLSFQQPVRSKLDFIKQMRKLKENTLAVNFQANPEIINHKKKREIYVFLEDQRQELLKSGRDPADVEEALKSMETKMLEKLERGELQIAIDKPSMMDSHQLAEIKRAQEARIKEALKIGSEYKIGSAFDFELQEKIRLEKVYKRELEKLEQMQREADDEEKQKADGDEELQGQIPIEEAYDAEDTPIIVAHQVEEPSIHIKCKADSKHSEDRLEKHKRKRHRNSSSDRSSSSEIKKQHKKKHQEKFSKKSKKNDRQNKRKYSSSDSSLQESEPRKKRRPSRFN